MFADLPAILEFRAGLSEVQRRRLNHPDSSFWAWKRSVSRTPARLVSAVEESSLVAPGNLAETGKTVKPRQSPAEQRMCIGRRTRSGARLRHCEKAGQPIASFWQGPLLRRPSGT
jgi:hypothetical protein